MPTTFTATHGVSIASVTDDNTGLPVVFELDRDRTGNGQEKVYSLEASDKVAAAISKLPESFLDEYGVRVAGGKVKAESAPPAEKPLADRSVAELKAYAAENQIDLGEASKKADILAAIEAADGSED